MQWFSIVLVGFRISGERVWAGRVGFYIHLKLADWNDALVSRVALRIFDFGRHMDMCAPAHEFRQVLICLVYHKVAPRRSGRYPCMQLPIATPEGT